MKKLVSICVLLLGICCIAQVKKLSQETIATSAGAQDDIVINYWNGATYTTKRISLTNLQASLLTAARITNSTLVQSNGTGANPGTGVPYSVVPINWDNSIGRWAWLDYSNDIVITFRHSESVGDSNN